jgi:hypothetical protein
MLSVLVKQIQTSTHDALDVWTANLRRCYRDAKYPSDRSDILSLFLFILRFGFSQSQTISILIEYVEKSIKKNIISVLLESSRSVLSYYTN